MGVILNKKQVKLKFSATEAAVTKYKAVQAPASQVSFKQLCKEVSASCGMSQSVTKGVVEALIDRIGMYAELGHGVSLGDFGSFKPVVRVRCKDTADEVDATTVKRVVLRFYPGGRFKEVMAGMSVTMDPIEAGTVVEGSEDGGGSGSGSGSGSGTGSGTGGGSGEGGSLG